MGSRKAHCLFKQQLPHWVQAPDIWSLWFSRTAKNDSTNLWTGPCDRALWWMRNLRRVSEYLKTNFGLRKIKPKNSGKIKMEVFDKSKMAFVKSWTEYFFKIKVFSMTKLACSACQGAFRFRSANWWRENSQVILSIKKRPGRGVSVEGGKF